MSEALKFKRNADLRREIVACIGGDPTRFPPGSERGIRKAQLVSLAAELTTLDELDARQRSVADLYPVLCDAVDVAYEPNAGHPWMLTRPQLKAIHRALDADAPGASAVVEVPSDD